MTMAILQNVDKCMRCNGCVIGCKRSWKMKADDPGVHKVAPDSRVMIKSQKTLDAGPFMRYSCWHCPDPPCARRCPFKAITKGVDGDVTVDHSKCDPDSALCTSQCLTDCQRGGYPKIGKGSNFPVVGKGAPGTFNSMQKCTLCHDKVNLNGDEDPTGTPRINNLPSKDPAVAHQPTCVYTCPAKAMTYDTQANIMAKAKALRDDARNGTNVTGNNSSLTVYPNSQVWGDGSVFWFSSKPSVAPKADPFMEDHVSPMVGSLFAGPWGRAAVIPTLLATGLFAIVAHRVANSAQKSEEVA
jgi:Fe-S-cluster-containing dehydrogenase component